LNCRRAAVLKPASLMALENLTEFHPRDHYDTTGGPRGAITLSAARILYIKMSKNRSAV
jgi:hypothetical protein